MDRPRDPEADARAARGAQPIDDREVESASYAAESDKGGGGGGGNDEHAATAVDGSSIEDTHEATPVGGGTIYSPASSANVPPAPSSDGGSGSRPPPGEANVSDAPPPPPAGSASADDVPDRRPPGTDIRGNPIPGYEDGATSTTSSDSSDSDGAYQVREGVTRAIDPEHLSTVQSDSDEQEVPHRRVESADEGLGTRPLDRPPDLPESVDVTNVAPDGTTIGGSRLTSPTGEAVGGSGLSDAIQSRAGELGGDALGRGIDFDPLASGTQGSGGGTTPGGGSDQDMDRLIQSRDGSYISDDRDPVQKVGDAVINFFSTLLDKPDPAPEDFKALPGPTIPENRRVIEPKFGDRPEDLKPLNTPSGQPDPTAGDDVLTGEAAERAIASHGTGVYSQPTQDDGDDSSGTTTVQWNAPTTDPRISNYGPEGEQTVDASGWTPPPDGIFDPPPESGTSASAGGALGADSDADLPITVEPAPPGTSGASALGGGETDLPITVEPAPPTGAMSLGGETDLPITVRTGPVGDAGELESKTDVNGATVDMVTGQVIGSAAPTSGGELGAAGGAVSQSDEGDDDGEAGVQSLAPSSTFATAAPLSAGFAADAISSQGGVDSGDAMADPSLATGAESPLAGGAPAAPDGLEGPPGMGEDGPPLPGEEG